MAATFDHRRPPRPPFDAAPTGLCRMCGDTVRGRARRWHQPCLHLWLICSDPRAARLFVFARDKGRCASCDYEDARLHGDWHVDHKLRLRDVPRILAYWLPANLQTLCIACHHEKTADENLRARKEQDDERTP